MDEETRELRHKLANVEQEKRLLEKMTVQAADQIDELAEADCSKPAIDKAKAKAEQLRNVAKMSSEGR